MDHGIVLASEVIGHIGALPVTNTLLVTWITSLILIAVSILATKKMSLIPSGLQNFVETIVEFGYNFTEDLAHDKTKYFFPICMTFFLFIVTANWIGIFPGFRSITFHSVPLFRSINSDLNTTLALALVSAVATHMFAIRFLGIKEYLGKWFSKNPIYLFVGLLELVSEFTKVVSLSFRLFGNIFAGEIVLSTIAGIFAFVLPLPFYFLEIIVGFVQATVFMLLSLAFMVILSEKHSMEGGH